MASHEVLYPRCILCPKIVGKVQTLRFPKVSRPKRDQFPKETCNYGNYIPRFYGENNSFSKRIRLLMKSLWILLWLLWVAEIFTIVWKLGHRLPTIYLNVKLVKIPKKQGYFLNHAHASIFISSHKYLVKLSMSVVVLRAYALNMHNDEPKLSPATLMWEDLCCITV